MYYNNGRYFYTNPPKKPTVEAKPVEYAFKNEVDCLKQEVDKHNNNIDYCLQAISVNRKDCEQMCQAIDILKYDMQQVKQIANHLYNRIESASNASKKKRRVTVCAGGQTVEVLRYD